MKKLLLILLLIPFFSIAQNEIIDTIKFDYDLLDKYVMEEVNKLRKRKRADSLIHDPSLDAASQDHAKYMGDNENLTHTQKSKVKRGPFDRVLYYGGTHNIVGENIQVVPVDYLNEKSKYRLTYRKLAKEIVDNWKGSKGHYANMINPEFVGVSHSYYEKDGMLYICQVFGSKPFVENYDFVEGESLEVKNKKECFGCKRLKKKLNKNVAYMGWYTVSNDSVFYWNVDTYWGEGYKKPKKHNLRKVFKGQGQIAIDVLHQEQYDCIGNPSYHNSLYHDGYYIGYVDKKAIKERDLHPSDNIVKVYVGMKPVFADTFYQVDFNLVKRKKPCLHSMTIYVSPDHLLPHEYFEIPKPEINLDKQLVIKDSVEIKIGFERNQTNQDTMIFQPLIKSLDSLVADNHDIQGIYFTGVASIEGSESANEKLFKRRGAIISNYLSRYYPGIEMESRFFENFDDFKVGLSGLGYHHLIGFPDDSLRMFANEHKNELAIANLLDETRYSYIRIIYADYVPIQPGSYGMSVQRLKDLSSEENIRELLPLYEVMANNAIEGDTVLGDSLLNLNFPETPVFAKLNWYKFILELNLTDMKVDEERLNHLKEIGSIPTDEEYLEYRLLFNVFYGSELINVDDFGDIHNEMRGKKHKAWIESLDLIMGFQNYRYDADMVVPILINNVLKKKFDLKQTYFICQFLIEWGYTEEPYLLLSKFARRPGQFPKLYRQYLKLGYFLGQFDNKKEWKKIKVVFKNLAEDHPKEFCDLFKWHQMGVRALEKEEIADLFCEKCRDTEPGED